MMDLKLFKSEDTIESRTGKIEKAKAKGVGLMKCILITRKNRYTGNSFKDWVSQWPEKYELGTIVRVWKETRMADVKETVEKKRIII